MGRMKSLGYAYAEHLGDGVDVDWYFESIVNGEIEIPKWFVEEWMEANPIFASENSGDYQIPYEELDSILEEMDVIDDENYSRYEELEKKFRELTTPNNNFPFGYGSLYYDYWNAKKALEEKVANLNFGAENSEDYEVIMTEIGHTMERDGRVQVFGDVVFGLPNNRRSRISSFGTGSDKASARQALIDRATGYLIEEEQLHDYMTRNHLEAETFDAEGNSMHHDLAKVADETRTRYRGNLDLSEIAAELRNRHDPYSDKKITLTHGQLIGVMCRSYKAGRADILDNFDEYREWNAETKSWRYQKRDASGRFAKGFQETVELSDFMEMNPDELPAVSETYTPEQVVAFINDCINDDDFPERMMDQVFLDSIQKVTAAADEELLEGLNAAANTALIEQFIYDDQAGIMGAKRAVFVTDVFLNFKWGQENWAAEDY